MQNPEQQRMADIVSVAMNSVANTGSALKIIGDLQAKNDSLAYQNISLALAINNIRIKLEEISSEIEEEYPGEKVIPAKIINIAKSKEARKCHDIVSNLNSCINSMRALAGGVQVAPSNMEAWYSMMQSLRNLGFNYEMKAPLSSNSDGANPVPSHRGS